LKYTEQKQIFLVLSRLDGTRCILKRTLLSSKESILDEYVILSTLSHPSIPKAIGYFEDDRYGYLIREYIPGSSLYDIIEKQGPMAEDRAIDTAAAVCGITDYLHNLNPAVIHRDIKPQNIIVTPEGEYKLIDMGTSRRFKDTAEQDTVFMGTQATAAPEQFGYRQTDQRSDIYGLGVLMVFLLTGSFQIKNGLPAPVSKALQRVIARCLEFEPDKRYANAGILKKRLQACIGRKKRNFRIMAVGISCAALMLAGLVILYYVNKPDPSKVAKFQSPLIEQAVRLELNKDEDDLIMKAELDDVTQILICGDMVFEEWNKHWQYNMDHRIDNERVEDRGTISELQDLKQLRNLDTLLLDKQDITDLSPLKGLPIKKLSLCDNRISDISILKTCSQLANLRLEGNPLTDIQPLSELKGIKVLDIGFNNVEDISALEKLSIRELYLLNTKVQDFTPLKSLPQLELFTVRYLPPKGLRVVKELHNLKELTIYESGIDSLKNFEQLTRLERLDLNSNELYDIDGVEKFPSLKSLGLGDNRIGSIAPLAGMNGLNWLDIADTSISDFTPLKDIPSLMNVCCNEGQGKQIQKALGDFQFQLEIR
jgi:serine/threonine protein kinase